MKTKITSYGNKENTNFQGKKIPKENVPCKCLSLIVLNSVVRLNKKYYPPSLLKECKYKITKNKVENLINDDLDSGSSDNESNNECDSESDSESNEESNDYYDNGSQN